jgi:hypothetical protein
VHVLRLKTHHNAASHLAKRFRVYVVHPKRPTEHMAKHCNRPSSPKPTMHACGKCKNVLHMEITNSLSYIKIIVLHGSVSMQKLHTAKFVALRYMMRWYDLSCLREVTYRTTEIHPIAMAHAALCGTYSNNNDVNQSTMIMHKSPSPEMRPSSYQTKIYNPAALQDHTTMPHSRMQGRTTYRK